MNRLQHLNRSKWLPTPGNVIFTLLVGAILLYIVYQEPVRGAANSPQASTNTISYQGQLTNATGSPLNGDYDLTFRLYNVANGGMALWTEQWIGANNVTVTDGLFHVMLGSITSIPQTIFTDNNTLWLGVKVGADSEMVPRIQLTSAPYPIQAQTVPNGSITTEKILDGAVTQLKAPQLVRSVFRQDGPTNNQTQTDQYLAKGWNCWGPTDGATTIYSKSVQFPIAFSDIPIIVLSLAGDYAQVSFPVSHGGLSMDMSYKPTIAPLNQVATGFSALFTTNTVYPAGHHICFTWLAIGTLPN